MCVARLCACTDVMCVRVCCVCVRVCKFMFVCVCKDVCVDVCVCVKLLPGWRDLRHSACTLFPVSGTFPTSQLRPNVILCLFVCARTFNGNKKFN